MKAVGYTQSLPAEHPEVLIDLQLPAPTTQSLAPHDLLVAVQAVSVNPVDTKVRRNRAPQKGQAEVLGWDAVGHVLAVGDAVRLFKVGDRVWYAGSIVRPGANAERHVVDERIVGRAPANLSDAEAAALPLTTITAWELLFDRLGVPQGGGAGQALLITGAAGGVGSILIQLARQLTQLTVIATASRAETRDWCLSLGAHHVIDHSKAFAPQLQAIGLPQVDLVASLTHTQQHFAQLVEVLAPQGKLGLIDDLSEAPDVRLLKGKSLSLHWEMMFARSMYGTPDMVEQHRLLTAVAALVESGKIKTTWAQTVGAINAANLAQAHRLVESGRMLGKVVLAGWPASSLS
ncbi:zinc-binding alcohol dehydrogenase family protein [Variovorax sp. HJSM1_2]|uniref:zinc-binding alcohol dehydrogenase family protein n=1 Tax=Variovorax sp. HJSM1_2 TaxID=3366263 RepID=UPI003BE6872C